MKKQDVIDFIMSLEDCEEVEKVYIENGIRKDYIEVSYYDKDEQFEKRSAVYEI